MDIYPLEHLSPWLSGVAVGLLVLLYGGRLVLQLRTLLDHLKRALGAGKAQAELEHALLEEGSSAVAGVVVLDEGGDFAVRVEIEQLGTQSRGHKKRRWSHRWVETGRRFFVRPFWIEHPSGERVRIEPSDSPRLRDKLDIEVQTEAKRRFRIAQLGEGDFVVAKGRLVRRQDATRSGQGYRHQVGHEWHLVMDEHSELIADRMSAHHRGKSWRLVLSIVTGWLPAALVTGFLLAPYFVAAIAGQATTVEFVGIIPAGSDTSQRVEVRLGDEILTESLTSEDRQRLDKGAGLDLVVLPILVGALFWLASFTVSLLWDKQEWYETKTLRHYGGGKLPSPQPSDIMVLSRAPAPPPKAEAPARKPSSSAKRRRRRTPTNVQKPGKRSGRLK